VSSPRVDGLIDAHAHLCDPSFDADLPEVLARARESGVAAVVAVGESMEDASRNLRLGRAYPGVVLPAAGQFPTRLDLAEAASLESWILEHAGELVAIGEVGLDYWKVQDEASREVQREIFGRFVRLAADLDLPLNVHSRSAGKAAVQFLLERGSRRVILHAFDGKPGAAMPAADAGYYFSIPPSVVRSAQKQRLVRALPLSSILLETDSPVLGPDPSRRNEPANLPIALDTVASIHDVAPERVAEEVRENLRRLLSGVPSWESSERSLP
jgi:TatD DNase family protein